MKWYGIILGSFWEYLENVHCVGTHVIVESMFGKSCILAWGWTWTQNEYIYIYNQRIWFEYGCWLIFHKRGRHPFIIIWSINQFTYCTVLANLTCFDSGANMNGKTTKHRATIGTCWTIIVRWSMFFSGHWATRFKKDFELTYYSWSFYWQPVRQDGIDMPIAQMMLRCIYVLWFLKDTSYSAKVWLKSGGCCWCSILEGIQSNSSDEPKCKWDMTAEIWGLIARWRHYNRTYRTLTHG